MAEDVNGARATLARVSANGRLVIEQAGAFEGKEALVNVIQTALNLGQKAEGVAAWGQYITNQVSGAWNNIAHAADYFSRAGQGFSKLALEMRAFELSQYAIDNAVSYATRTFELFRPVFSAMSVLSLGPEGDVYALIAYEAWTHMESDAQSMAKHAPAYAQYRKDIHTGTPNVYGAHDVDPMRTDAAPVIKPKALPAQIKFEMPKL